MNAFVSRTRPFRAGGAALCLALLGTVAAPAGAVEVEALTSPGGIAFLHAPIAGSDRVSIQVAWPSDWAYTEPDVGAPYVGAELMVAGGAGERSAAEVRQAFEDLQAEGYVNVIADTVTGTFVALAKDLDEAVGVAADVLARPTLDERGFERVRDGFASSIAQSAGTPDTLVGRTLRRLIYGDSGLTRFLSTAPADVATDVSPDDVRRWHDETFVRDGMRVAVAGGIDAAAAGEAIDTLLGGLPPGDGPSVATKAAADFSPREVLLHVPDAGQGIVALAGPLPPASTGGELDDFVAAVVLGSGSESRLFEAVRTRLSAGHEPQVLLAAETRQSRSLLMYAGVDAGQVAESREAMLDAYATLRDDGPTADEVRLAIAQLRVGVAQTFEQAPALAQTVLASALDGYLPSRVAAVMDELDAITPASVKARLQSAWPAPDVLLQVMLAPDAQAVSGACVIESVDAVSGCD